MTDMVLSQTINVYTRKGIKKDTTKRTKSGVSKKGANTNKYSVISICKMKPCENQPFHINKYERFNGITKDYFSFLTLSVSLNTTMFN